MSGHMEEVVVFGRRLENVDYLIRRGVYGVVLDRERSKVAPIKARNGYFLPGGGVKSGETDRECLAREGMEEMGYEIIPTQFIGRAQKYDYIQAIDTYTLSDGFFYLAALADEQGSPTEADHELVWTEKDKAIDILTHEHQAWAVGKALGLA